jgi:hypothetical protein
MNSPITNNATIQDPVSFFRRLSDQVSAESPASRSGNHKQLEPTTTMQPRLDATVHDAGELRKNIEANVIVLLNAIDRATINSTTKEAEVQRGIGEAIRIIDTQLSLLKNIDQVRFTTLNQALESTISALNRNGYGYDKSGYQT